jgi:hypothetical protein
VCQERERKSYAFRLCDISKSCITPIVAADCHTHEQCENRCRFVASVIAHAAEFGGMVLGIGVRRDFIFG